MLHFLWRKFPFTLNLKSVYLWEAQAKNMQIWGTMQMGDLLVTAVISVPLIIIIVMMKSYILKSIVQVSLNPSDPSLGGFDWKPHLAHGSTAVPTTRQFRFNLTTFRQLFLVSLHNRTKMKTGWYTLVSLSPNGRQMHLQRQTKLCTIIAFWWSIIQWVVYCVSWVNNNIFRLTEIQKITGKIS